MTRDEAPQPDLAHDQLERYFDAELTDAERAQLNDLLRRDPAARRAFIDYYHYASHLATALERTTTTTTTTTDLSATPLDLGDKALAKPSPGPASELGDKARGKPSPCRETPTQTAQNPSRKRNRPHALLRHWQLWAAAAAVVLAIPLVSHFSYIFKFDFNWGGADTSEDLLQERVAILFEISDGAEFTYDGPGRYDPQLKQGEDIFPGVIDLKYGTLNISFDSKAEVTLKAPAKFYLNHPKRARLEHGELTAYCPPEAKGFTIGAPGCAVIDLGTRFWMKVDKFGFTDVTVREGRVDLRRDNGEVVSLLRGAKARASRELTERLQVDGPLLTVVDATGDLYVNDTLAGIGEQHPAGEYSLSSGTAEVMLTNAVNVKLHGRSSIAMHSPRSVSLDHGSFSFNCPPGARGFTVGLPDGSRIVDLNAEFSVHVDDKGHARFRVTEGRVEWISPDPLDEPVLVEAGGSLRIASGVAVREASYPIPIVNPSFEADENPNSVGSFIDGERRDFPSQQLTAWIAQSGAGTEIAVGWIGRDPETLHPFPPVGSQESQMLSLQSGASVLNTTSGLAWSSLSPGQTLKLTIAVGLNSGNGNLNWTESSFFGLTDGAADFSSIQLTDTVANTGLIANNPQTGDQSGSASDAPLVDVTVTHVVTAADLLRPGVVGILIYADGSGGAGPQNAAAFDTVRLSVVEPETSTSPNPSTSKKESKPLNVTDR